MTKRNPRNHLLFALFKKTCSYRPSAVMTEVVSGSQDGVCFWDSKTFAIKKRAEPFAGSHAAPSSLSWGTNSIHNCCHSLYVLLALFWGVIYIPEHFFLDL